MATLAFVIALGASASLASATPSSAANAAAQIGSAAALEGANCDPQAKSVKMVYFAPPPCVTPWKKNADNGGATMAGVTRSTIKVVVYTGFPADQVPENANDRSLGQLATDLSTGSPGRIADAVHDTHAAASHALESYGRTVEFTYLTRTGNDEAAQRADAVTATARKPFAVLDLAGAETFCSEVAARKTIAICATGTNKAMDAQQPYRYSTYIDYWANEIGTAELIGKGLEGKPARWAGDSELQGTTRKFGVIYQNGQTGIDEELWKSSLSKYKAPSMAVELPYDPGTADPTGNGSLAQEQAPTMISKLKDAGVTTVVLFTDLSMNAALMNQANQQEYKPEWLQTGFLFSEIGAIGQLMNQTQWSHSFGLGTLNVPIVDRPVGEPLLAWYWGDRNFSYSAGVFGEIVILDEGIHLAGPKLTPASFRAGVFGVGAHGGAAANDAGNIMLARGKAPGVPYTEYLFGGDHTLIWWNPEAVPTNSTTGTPRKGAPMYLEHGTRYLQGDLPKGEPKFFDESASVVELPEEPKPLPAYPCVDCPSTGSGDQPGA
jgi:hypothetical protein